MHHTQAARYMPYCIHERENTVVDTCTAINGLVKRNKYCRLLVSNRILPKKKVCQCAFARKQSASARKQSASARKQSAFDRKLCFCHKSVCFCQKTVYASPV